MKEYEFNYARKDVESIYTPLHIAKEEIWKRWNDRKLEKRIEAFFDRKLPKVFKSSPKAIFSRYIITPNFEFIKFLDSANLIKLNPACLEYSKDKFVAKNLAKYYLGKIFFYNGEGKNGGQKISSVGILDFNTWEGRQLCDIETISGENLLDFHHKMIEKVQCKKMRCEIEEFSDWFKERRNRTEYYYLYYLSLFIRNGILFENFLTTKAEYSFTKNKVLPSFKKAEELFGVRPLIVKLESTKSETDNRWYYYPNSLECFVREKIEVNNKNLPKEPILIIKDTKKYGKGVFAGENIKKGQVIKVLSGEVISFDECIKRIESGVEAQTDSLQIGLEQDLDLDEFSRTFNHSCNPNAGLRKISEMVALRDIKKNEEITYDYSATTGPNIEASLWSMQCSCGLENCRKRIGNILSIPEKQLNKYKRRGALQDYILTELKKIKADKQGSLLLPSYNKINLNIKNNGL